MNWFVLCYSGISCFVFQVLGLGQNPVNEQGKTIASRMAVLESVGFSQSYQATQGAKSKWIWIFKRKK